MRVTRRHNVPLRQVILLPLPAVPPSDTQRGSRMLANEVRLCNRSHRSHKFDPCRGCGPPRKEHKAGTLSWLESSVTPLDIVKFTSDCEKQVITINMDQHVRQELLSAETLAI